MVILKKTRTLQHVYLVRVGTWVCKEQSRFRSLKNKRSSLLDFVSTDFTSERADRQILTRIFQIYASSTAENSDSGISSPSIERLMAGSLGRSIEKEYLSESTQQTDAVSNGCIITFPGSGLHWHLSSPHPQCTTTFTPPVALDTSCFRESCTVIGHCENED